MNGPLTIEQAIEEEFWVCYECRDSHRAGLPEEDHHCIGIPCMCPCYSHIPEPEEPEYAI